MNKSFGTLDGKNPTFLNDNDGRKQSRWVMNLLIMAVFAVFMCENVFGQTPTTITDVAGLNGMTATGNYVITTDIEAASYTPSLNAAFSGTLTAQAKADGTFPVISGLTRPLFTTVTGAHISNIMLKEVAISQDGDVGAICCTANGDARIYSCGILPTNPINIFDNPSTVASSNSHNCGSLVGLLDGTARVINCFSYAWITQGGGGNYYVGGLVGNNNQTSVQTSIKTMVVNCMFYGDINTGNCANYAPVYGNKVILNDSNTGINPYDFFRESATFDNGLSIAGHKTSWPVLEEYLTRFEYYRSIFNSNRRLCTWWVNGTNGTTPTDEEVTTLDLAKWVLDPSIAPYPILKKWGKYPSVINPDPDKVWDDNAGVWVQRANAAPYQGKSLGTLSISVNPGNHAPTGISSTTITRTITDMDTLHFDYGYCKVQLPYYNELFGDPSSNDHNTRYGGNYTDYVVTGWKITEVTGGTPGSFKGYAYSSSYGSYTPDVVSDRAWEDGFNFADRNCTNKDLYAKSGRVFAQGGYYYVPEGVTAITIEAYWGKAFYMHNTGHYLDRVKMTNHTANGSVKLGEPFVPAGTLPTAFQGHTVYTDWRVAIKALDAATLSNNTLSFTVYDQAIVLIGNFQIRNENGAVGYDVDSKWHPYTIMSIDQDFDNEPDYCFELQFRRQFARPCIQPIRFDFLTVPELGMAVRHNQNQNTIGIFTPQGHFEITETSYMHTTQFEYDNDNTNNSNYKVEGPVILNGGHFEQIVVRRGDNDHTSYFLLGGHFRMLRFTPGRHCNRDSNGKITRHCAVNVLGGDYPEFYLSGIYNVNAGANQDNPHCYVNGGHFGMIAGAGYEKVDGSITFKIDHSIIGEFYGGGINGSKPITGSIDVTIDNSLVEKYCGGPKIGVMGDEMTVTTHATGSIFGHYYGGGNGGTSYYREQKQDGNVQLPASTAAGWANYGFSGFNPLNTINGVGTSYQGTGDNKGYHALFEFECFVESNGLGENPTVRSYLHWAQFGTTTTGDVSNTLVNCTVKNNFYGGGNLANVNGNVTSTLTDCIVKGNVYGGGFSGKIEPFRIHDKSQAHFPYIDGGGLMQDGMNRLNSLEYIDREYTWCYKNASGQMFPQGVVIPAGTNTGRNATFEYPVGSNKWYVLTTVPLEGLGAVENSVSLTLEGSTTVGTPGVNGTGNVFGGGDESEVLQNTLVLVKDQTKVLGNIYGGGNIGKVGGDTKVIINGVMPQP